MILSDVMDELAERLGTIDGLRAYGWPVESVSPPAGFVGYPEAWDYDETMRRGMDRTVIPVAILIGNPDARSSRDRLSKYLDGAGSASVKSVLEAEDAGYTSFDSCRVQGADIDVYALNGVEYLTAIFQVDIAGNGA